jgi:hypothetical protein
MSANHQIIVLLPRVTTTALEQKLSISDPEAWSAMIMSPATIQCTVATPASQSHFTTVKCFVDMHYLC